MPTYIITCPICQKQYKLTPKDPSSIAQKKFTCMNCKYSAPFSTLVKNLPQPQPVTHSGDMNLPVNPQKHSATKVAHGLNVQSKAFLTVMGSNTKFILNPGLYILGRKSSDSTATLQLAPDISMSRQHARLVVQSVAGKLMVQVVALKANNPLVINGKLYTAGHPCNLKSGDRLQLGMTTVIITL